MHEVQIDPILFDRPTCEIWSQTRDTEMGDHAVLLTSVLPICLGLN